MEMNIAAFLKKYGAHLPERERRDLRELLAHRMNMTTASLLAWPEKQIDAPTCAQLEKDMNELAQGKPMAHLLGTIPFLDWQFYIDERALIPRPETEALCERITLSLKDNPPQTILDLCCGSGVMGIALALHFPEAQLLLTDICPHALALAKKNTEQFPQLQDRVRIVQGDLWQAVAPEERFDLIMANPPYVANTDPVEASVRNYEPSLALYSDDQGMTHIKEILHGLPQHLTENGSAAFELGHEHHQLLSPFLLEQSLPWQFLADPFGVPRYLFMANWEMTVANGTI